MGYSNGNTYQGQWKNNKRHGQGTYVFRTGHKYEGSFRNNLKHGKGTYYWPEGIKYVGNFVNDKKEGEGILYTQDGLEIKGIWENEEYLGSKELVLKKQNELRLNKERIENEKKASEELERIALEQERLILEEEQRKFNKIYNNCLLNKSAGVDMSIKTLKKAVEDSCSEIASNPSYLDKLRYN